MIMKYRDLVNQGNQDEQPVRGKEGLCSSCRIFACCATSMSVFLRSLRGIRVKYTCNTTNQSNSDKHRNRRFVIHRLEI